MGTDIAGVSAADPPPQVSAKWVQRGGQRRIHVTATRGAVSTEATLTEGEARELTAQLSALLDDRGTCWITRWDGRRELCAHQPVGHFGSHSPVDEEVNLLYAREGDPLQYAYKPGTYVDLVTEPYAPTAEAVATFVAPETGWYEIPGFRKLEDAEVKARGLR